jgi:hypothetical protein
MLLLTAASQPLILYPNTGFNLTVSGPVEGEQAGAYIYSVVVPYDGNAQKFGFPARLTRLVTQKASIAGEIRYGLHLLNGEWNAKSSNGKTIELEMVIGGSHFNALVEGHTLPEYFDITTAIADFPAHINAQVALNYPEVNHQFPSILNTKFYGDKNAQYSGVINDFDNDFIEDLNATAIVPQLYWLYVIKRMFEAANYRATGNAFNDDLLKVALMYNNFSLEHPLYAGFSAKFSTDAVYNPWVVKFNVDVSDPLNVYDETTGLYTVLYAGNYQINLSSQIKPLVNNPAINKLYIVTFYGTEIIDSSQYDIADPSVYDFYNIEFLYDVLPENIGLDFSMKIYYTDVPLNLYEAYIYSATWRVLNTAMVFVNTFGTEINYKNHVPNMEVKAFFAAFCSAFKILPIFDHSAREVELVFMRDSFAQANSAVIPEGLIRDSLKVYESDYDGLTFGFDFQGPDELLNDNFKVPRVLHGTVDTFLDLPTLVNHGDIYLVTSLNAYYIYTYIPPPDPVEGEPVVLGSSEFLIWGDRHHDVVYDNGTMPIRSTLAPMLMRNLNRVGANRSLPSIEAEANSSLYDLQGDFPLRIMFYVGMVNSIWTLDGSNSFFYPFASTTKYDTAANVVLPINYQWTDLISRYWLPVIAWYKRRMPIEFTNLVTPEFIANIKLSKRFRFQNTLIFLDEVVVKIKSKLFGPGDFKGWTG